MMNPVDSKDVFIIEGSSRSERRNIPIVPSLLSLDCVNGNLA
jgi:hypothetical protein